MFKRSLILPALAVLALAACDDNNAEQTSSTDTTTTASEVAPATGEADTTTTTAPAMTETQEYTPTTNPETMGGGGGGIPDEQRTATENDTMGNAGPTEGMSADETPAAPNPETFNEEAATDAVDDATCGDYSAWVGQPVDEAALTETGKVYRVMKAGDAMTMDHNPDRINVEQDDAGIVTRVWCG